MTDNNVNSTYSFPISERRFLKYKSFAKSFAIKVSLNKLSKINHKKLPDPEELFNLLELSLMPLLLECLVLPLTRSVK